MQDQQPPPDAIEMNLTFSEVHPSSTAPQAAYLDLVLTQPVTLFIGRNGSGKSRTARALARKYSGHFLSTDRLIGLMKFSSYDFGAIAEDYRGVPVGDTEQWASERSRDAGTATQELFALRDYPDVALRVAAFLRRTLGRTIELRERSGFLDPVIRIGADEYSLFRDEGHGLRELVVLLTALYRPDWQLLVVDEPELHLHPSMARLWISELSKECNRLSRRAIVVTHEPSLVHPTNHDHLGALWLFSANSIPRNIGQAVLPVQKSRITASLMQNPALLASVAFSPRPVLVEGPTDAAALTMAVSRLFRPEVVAQTDFVECGGSGGVALWLEVCKNLGLDVRAIADLDACFAPEVQRVMDADPRILEHYRTALLAKPAKTHVVVSPLLRTADEAGIPADPRNRAQWLATADGVDGERRDRILSGWAAAGLWLHKQGTLENVLGLNAAEKGVNVARQAAGSVGAIDDVAKWCAFELDMGGDLELVLSAAVEAIAHRILEAQRTSPGSVFESPVGSLPGTERLVSVAYRGNETYRITVRSLQPFAGYFVDVSRDTPPSSIVLHPPA